MPKKFMAKKNLPKKRKFNPAPAARGAVSRTREPKIFQRGKHTVVVHEEYLGDVLTDSLNQFAYDLYIGNPGDPVTFPWLAAIARRFESYRFVRHVMRYVGYAGTGTSGEAVLAIDYDAKDPTNDETKTTLLSTGNSVSGSLWDTFEHVSSKTDLQRLGPYRFVFDGALTPMVDRTDSYGNIYVATTPSSAPSGTAVGEIWISYEVEFLTPVMTGLSSSFTPSSIGQTLSPITSSADGLIGFAARVTALTGNPQAYIGPQTLGVLAGPPAMNPSQWLLEDGTVLGAGRIVLQFAKDFVGKIIVKYANDLAGDGPDLASAAVAAVARDTLASGFFSSSSAFGDVDINGSRSTSDSAFSGANYTGILDLDANIPAGGGVVVAVPTFSATTGLSGTCELLPTPNNLAASFTANLKARIQKKKAKLTECDFSIALRRFEPKPATQESTTAASATPSKGDVLTVDELRRARMILGLGPDDQRPTADSALVAKYLSMKV